MRKGFRLALASTVAALAPCIWDSSTLADELRGAPDAHDILIGRWFRHGPAYYEERIRRLSGRAELGLADYDDLAVAHERLGDHARAIEVMRAKERVLEAHPDTEHLYGCHANLGTFYAHDGEYQQALIELDKAVEFHSEAHFGRERFQVELVRYLLATESDPDLWETDDFLSFMGRERDGRVGSAIRPGADRPPVPEDAPAMWLDMEEADTAVADMLRFGGPESPELCRSLGDIFQADLKLNLAWWAWQRALELGHPARQPIEAAIRRLEKDWKQYPYHGDNGRFVPPTGSIYRAQRANADAWLAAAHAAEADALAAGLDPDHPDVRRDIVSRADVAVPRLEIDQVAFRISNEQRLFALLFGLLTAFYACSRALRSRRSGRRGGDRARSGRGTPVAAD